MTFAQTGHTTAFAGPFLDHWLEWKIAQHANAGGSKPLQLSALPHELRLTPPIIMSTHCHKLVPVDYQCC